MSLDPEGTVQTDDSPPTEVAADPNAAQRLKDTQAALHEATTQIARLKKDPEALKGLLDEWGYSIEDDEEPEPEPDPTEHPDVAALRKELADIKAAQEQSGKSLAEINTERAEAAFNRDLKAAAGDRDVSDKARDWILQRTLQTGNNPEALTEATKDWFDFEDTLRGPSTKRPRVPHVPSGGTAPEAAKPFHKMTDQERLAYQVERFNSGTA